ncbi:hypothetical protein [Pontibacter litorisediminis]|uniref:hypothetical protein n=1 Tax=Pontibacter litorisediminis TaxID=1846260 RepID=UPI0023EBA317|nr:hypothetical protein [Pontibacter litorisediminis]
MKAKRIRTTAAALFSASLLLASCGGEYGENTEMPPESTTGETQETGAPIDGDKPGTGADSASINDVLAGEEDTATTNP